MDKDNDNITDTVDMVRYTQYTVVSSDIESTSLCYKLTILIK